MTKSISRISLCTESKNNFYGLLLFLFKEDRTVAIYGKTS